jgi:pimeloyl-ACP methyl ester carboxylesterase
MADYRARVARASVDSLQSAIGACMTHDMRGKLAEVRAPTLVMTGSDDYLVPPFHAEHLNRAIPMASLTVIPGSGHIPNIEAPGQFLHEVREFLSSLGSA